LANSGYAEAMTHHSLPQKKARGFGLAEIIVLVAVVGILVLIGWQLYTARKQSVTSPPASTSHSGAPSQNLSTGTDTHSLEGDLTTINSNLSQSGQSLNASDSAVNDQQNQISIPVN
jgi:cytoskeletal protein RodZ